ncbi:MAG: RibD family protein [Actinobacteria bacterium]|nr:RibD family protein [Actinomycetota bacterium]
MTLDPAGPGAPFESLIETPPEAGAALPPEFKAIFGGPWTIPPAGGDRPYVYINFATSRDGRVSFSMPGHSGGGDVTGFNAHDRWLMGLLRARADAILMGDNTLRTEPEHLWTPGHIFPEDEDAFNELHAAEKRRSPTLLVFLSLKGDIPSDAAVFGEDVEVVIATTHLGAETAHKLKSATAQVDVLELGDDGVDIVRLMTMLRSDYGVERLLCEGGPRVYGSLLAAGQVDDEFIALCPIMIGDSPDGPHCPSLVEGVRFAPGRAPQSRIVGLRRADNHLFLRSRYLF